MSELVKVVKVISIGSIGYWSNFEGVWEVSTSVGVVIRNKSLGLVYRHAPGINTGGKDPTKICMTWGNTSLVPVLYQFQCQGYTCLIHTSPKSVLDQISRPDWYEKFPKVPNTKDQTGMRILKHTQYQDKLVECSKVMPYQHWNRLTATLRVDNHGSQKSKNQLWYIIMVLKNLKNTK
jgi:hypothetical protein